MYWFYATSCFLCIISRSQGNLFRSAHRSAVDNDHQEDAVPSGVLCEVDNIPTQSGFDSVRFAGTWYLVSDYNVEGQFVSNFVDIDDVQAVFTHRPGGDMKISTGTNTTTSSKLKSGLNSIFKSFRTRFGFPYFLCLLFLRNFREIVIYINPKFNPNSAYCVIDFSFDSLLKSIVIQSI